jgi:hypothetical protein
MDHPDLKDACPGSGQAHSPLADLGFAYSKAGSSVIEGRVF